MKGDFSKMTFAPGKNFLRVLMQQGRVQLDADWNEQAAILLHYIQTLATDLIGPYAGPIGNLGFGIYSGAGIGNFAIGKGRYYVNGVLCENHYEDVTYLKQPDYLPDTKNPLESLADAGTYLVYLDVWERHISYLEDDDIREKALNGVDTATRSKVIWQVKIKKLENGENGLDAVWALKEEPALSKACLRARVKPEDTTLDVCCQHPDAKYRGAENQLYRVEIHNDGSNDEFPLPPSFKWSRENGSVVFPVTRIAPDAENNRFTVELENLGRDDKLSLAVNDWVELADDDSVLKNTANPLCQVLAIDPMERTVVLTGPRPIIYNKSKHTLLRRWDQKGDVNGVPIITGLPAGKVRFPIEAGISAGKGWLPIEAGIEVEFQLHGALRTGDYWLIPARTGTGEVEWPKSGSDPDFMSPHGVEHDYAPLAIIEAGEGGTINYVSDYRCKFGPLSYGCYYSYYGRLGAGIGTDLLCHEEIKQKV